jgi:hypothetical protein
MSFSNQAYVKRSQKDYSLSF